MLRLRLGKIPLDIHASLVVVLALLAYGSLPGAGEVVEQPGAWPYRELLEPASPEHLRAAVLYVLVWVGTALFALLVHELGHALVARAFGGRPSIVLAWLGGRTEPHARGALPWRREVAVTLAGPLVGLGMGLSALLLCGLVGERSEVASFVLRCSARAHLVWSGLNLLPVLPMDGGRLAALLATRVLGPQGFKVVQVPALVVSAALVALAVVVQSLLLGVLFTLLGLRTLWVLTRSQGQAPPVHKGRHAPLRELLAQAREALAEGRLEQAQRLGQRVLEHEQVPPELGSRAHYLLGWVALKEGRGRTALGHFSQVQGQPVETQALAAAFCLVGDELRALPLWEMAWRETRDRTVLHEYAGSLIRFGRPSQALRLPGVSAAQAFACAMRVLALRGAWSEAGALGESALEYVRRAELAYEAACAYAQARLHVDALRMLRRASELGFQDVEYAASDADLAPLHGRPEFEEWLAGLQQKSAFA